MAAIFFDVDGTLVRWRGDYGDVLADAFERAAGGSRGEWLEHYDDQFFHHFGAFADDPYHQAFADVCDEHDLDCDPGDLAEALVAAEFDAVEPVPGVAATVEALAERHTLGILTNGLPDVQFGKVAEIGLLDRFDARVASHDPEIEATKPDREIYEAAKSRVDADRYVMVGDDREPDIDGAREHGFETVHVDATAADLSAPDFRTLSVLL
ncbi:haloacid dehalogenase superfamily enzyme, subfamily IA [Halosimplex carlsbadense 2-9-1]|uniref:Haloacid dehalogenase superfamily enzyme, subfamily IA n=1 Tax=Halosimplex carlsbadense 2-9-1 TaxID=797114 RepID=M0CK58_9EURY|nr:HAD family hydrolase [Halosimplex carlsbadense]ELZ22757.1 haloacid dehalogenase superfamily enzyme, subfamily IA [Halosimplex carlsbadense 2-9-1]